MKKEKKVQGFDGGVIYSPADGKILPLSLVEDEVFSAGILGSRVVAMSFCGPRSWFMTLSF